MKNHFKNLMLTFLAVSVLWSPVIYAKKATPTVEPSKTETSTEKSPVVLDGRVLFYVQERALSFSPEDRAKAISQRIDQISKNPLAQLGKMKLDVGESSTDIVLGERILMTVTDKDALSQGRSREELAIQYMGILQNSMDTLKQQYSVKQILKGIGFAALSTFIFLLLLKVISMVLQKTINKLNSWRGTRIRSLKFQSFVILPANQMTDVLIGISKITRVLVVFLLLYFYVPLLLSFFPWTYGLATQIFEYILDPLIKVVSAVFGYIPNLFFIAVIFVVTQYFLKLVKLIFAEIGRGNIAIQGFYREWAEPTYKIVRFLIMAFALVVVFPYLPGADSPAFQGISIFLGVLFSLGSTSAVANVVAGVVLTYMRPFMMGDRVKIADTVGDVVERNLLITRVRTIKNVYVTIPNSMVLGSHIINFSASAKDGGLILNTSVTIGYDVPWKQVHELLISAAKATQLILDDPKPFVLQIALDDFYVQYELNACTDQPNKMASIYSELHQNIQDQFNKAGVEIMSPHYSALRDGNQTAIPKEDLPKDYQSPGFKIFPWSK